MVHADVRGERIAAEHRNRIVGDGADDRDRAGPGQRQQPVVLEDDDRLLGDASGERPVCLRVEIDRAVDRCADGQRSLVEAGRHR